MTFGNYYYIFFSGKIEKRNREYELKNLPQSLTQMSIALIKHYSAQAVSIFRLIDKLLESF